MIQGLYLVLAFIGFSFLNTISNSLAHPKYSKKAILLHANQCIEQKKKTRFNLINDALKNFKATLNEEKKTPYMISLDYEVDGENNPLTTITRTYYKEYRKEPKRTKQTYRIENDKASDHNVRFVYKSCNNYILQVNDEDNRRQISRIKLSKNFVNSPSQLV